MPARMREDPSFRRKSLVVLTNWFDGVIPVRFPVPLVKVPALPKLLESVALWSIVIATEPAGSTGLLYPMKTQLRANTPVTWF